MFSPNPHPLVSPRGDSAQSRSATFGIPLERALWVGPDAALSVIRTKGFSATTVDKLCSAAGVTKGAFFHHFKSRMSLASPRRTIGRTRPGHCLPTRLITNHADPLDRVIGYLEFRKSLLQGGVSEFTCLVGTMVQETYETAPAIRKACDRSISGHAATLEADIEEAMRARAMSPQWTAKSLALHTQAVVKIITYYPLRPSPSLRLLDELIVRLFGEVSMA